MRKTSFMVILEYVFFWAAVEMNACVRARECVRYYFLLRMIINMVVTSAPTQGLWPVCTRVFLSFHSE